MPLDFLKSGIFVEENRSYYSSLKANPPVGCSLLALTESLTEILNIEHDTEGRTACNIAVH